MAQVLIAPELRACSRINSVIQRRCHAIVRQIIREPSCRITARTERYRSCISRRSCIFFTDVRVSLIFNAVPSPLPFAGENNGHRGEAECACVCLREFLRSFIFNCNFGERFFAVISFLRRSRDRCSSVRFAARISNALLPQLNPGVCSY